MEKLEQTHADSIASKDELETRIEMTGRRLKRAGELLAALRSEWTRWASERERLLGELAFVPGNTLFCAASLTLLRRVSASAPQTCAELLEHPPREPQNQGAKRC